MNSWVSNAGEIASRIQKLADGRQISVARRRMADGGLVVTHEDITERERLNARLEEQHELLKAQEEKLRSQNLQLDAALNNMVQGLAMYDADQRLVLYNKRYVEIYGIPTRAWCCRPCSSHWPRRSGSSYRSASGYCGRPAPPLPSGRGR